MFQTNTFLEFIKNSDISSKIQDSVFNYCEHHHSFLCQCIYDYDVYRVVDVSDVDIHINAVWIDDNKESSLNFDIAVEVDAEVDVLMCFRESNYREVNRFFTMKTGEPLTKHKS